MGSVRIDGLSECNHIGKFNRFRQSEETRWKSLVLEERLNKLHTGSVIVVPMSHSLLASKNFEHKPRFNKGRKRFGWICKRIVEIVAVNVGNSSSLVNACHIPATLSLLSIASGKTDNASVVHNFHIKVLLVQSRWSAQEGSKEFRVNGDL